MELPLRCGGEVLFRHEQLLDERHRRASMTPSWNGGLGGSLAMVLLMCLVLPPKSRSSAFVMRGNRDGHSSAASISTAAGRSNTACSRDSNRLGRNILAFSVGSVLGPTNRGRARLEKLNKRRVGVDQLSMALKYKLRKRRNIPGEFFVDESCVDCDICRWMDPRTFERSGLGAVVASQPKTKEERMKAFQAMLACPSGSIRTMRPDKQVIDALATFPLAVDEERLPGIYQLAPTTRMSMGNTAYLIVRPGKGNIMIDVPRYLKKTAAKVEALGGVQYMIVTGMNNAYGHERWKQHFPGMTRILHRLDLMTKTRVMEERLDEKGPWYLVEHGKESRAAGYVTGLTARFDFVKVPDEERAPKDPTVKIVGLAGQTRGSIGVIYELETDGGRREKVAFSGGTVGLSSYLGRLDTFARTAEMGKDVLGSSVERLAQEDITCLLPGRGARVLYDSEEAAKDALQDAANQLALIPNLLANPLIMDRR